MENRESGWEQLNVFDDLFRLINSPRIITTAKLRENEILIISADQEWKQYEEYQSHILNLEQKKLDLLDADIFKGRQTKILEGQRCVATGAQQLAMKVTVKVGDEEDTEKIFTYDGFQKKYEMIECFE